MRPQAEGDFFSNKKAVKLMTTPLFVAGLGVEPSLRDYEPHVQPYTTPHVLWSTVALGVGDFSLGSLSQLFY